MKSQHTNVGTARLKQHLSSACCGNLIPSFLLTLSIFCPLFTLLSLHFTLCLTSALSPFVCFCYLSFPLPFDSSLPTIHLTEHHPTPVDLLSEISAKGWQKREMLFRGNFSRAGLYLSVPFQQAELSVELGYRPRGDNEM